MGEFKPINQLNIPRMFAQSRQYYGSRVAMRYHNGYHFVDITYDCLHNKIMQAVFAMEKAGIGKGDRVAILSENRPEWGIAYFASLYLQAVNVPLDALLKPHEWAPILRNSEAKAIVVSQKFYPYIEPMIDEIRSLETVICMDSQCNSAPYLLDEENPSELPAPDTDIDELAAIIYTSGTTGLPKGVMLSHGNITSDIHGLREVISLYPHDNFMSILPLHHTFECTCGFLTPISSGSAVTYARGLASKLIVEDIKTSKATIIIGVPLVFEKMYAGLTKAVARKSAFTRAKFKTFFGLAMLLKKSAKADAGRLFFSSLREKAGMASLRLMVAGGAPMSASTARARSPSICASP